jgi:hypothetical protein
MTAKEYLSRLHLIDVCINQKIRELDDLRASTLRVGGVDYSGFKVVTSPKSEAAFARNVERAVLLDEEINREIDEFAEEKHRIINEIHQLSNPLYVELLYKRYVEFKRLEVIAVDMNYTYEYVRKMHGRALQSFERCHTMLHLSVV